MRVSSASCILFCIVSVLHQRTPEAKFIEEFLKALLQTNIYVIIYFPLQVVVVLW